MVTIFKAMMAFVLLGFGFNASAQFCVPQQGAYINPVSGMREDAPRFFDRDAGCYITYRPQNAGAANHVVVPGVVPNPLPAYWGVGPQYDPRYHPRHVQQGGAWGNWGVQPQQVLIPACRLVQKTAGEVIGGTIFSAVRGVVAGEGAGLIARGIRGRDNNYEQRGRQVGGGAGLVAGALDTDKWDCSERDAFIAAQQAAARQQAVATVAVPAQVAPAVVQPQQGVVLRNPCADDPGTEPAVVINPNVINPKTGLSRLNETVCARRGDTNVRFP